MSTIERTLVLLKPDAVKRGLMGEIMTRFEKAGYKIVGVKLKQADSKMAGEHYGEDIIARRGEKVRNMLMEFVSTSPVLAMVIEGVEAIENVRMMVGATEPKAALPGTIRGDYAHVSYKHADAKDKVVENLIHASSDANDAQREIPIWFAENELCNYTTVYEVHTM
jgi:nucleoside-diphosphate kinase